MRAFMDGAGVGANGHDDRFVIEKTTGDKSVADDENWFSDAVLLLYPEKPGTALHYIAEKQFDERSCQRYAAGTVKPPAYFLRALLRSPHGWQFLAATMDGSDVEWWRDVERARAIKDAIDKVSG